MLRMRIADVEFQGSSVLSALDIGGISSACECDRILRMALIKELNSVSPRSL